MTDRYAVIGNPVAHSKSPFIHSAFAAQTGEPLTYSALLATLDGFAAAVAEFANSGGRGLNVTVPFKLEARNLATRLSDRARAAGAVNTLTFSADGIAGDNTDGVGLVHDITYNLKFGIAGRRVLLLGAGGAARGVILSLLSEAPAALTIANRTVARAEELASRFASAGNVKGLGFNDLRNREFDLIINATSASLRDELPAIPGNVFAKHALAYDMMYGKNTMPFLALAKGVEARTADGLGMLVEQAAESFFIWRGVRPATAPVLEQLREAAA